MIVLDSGDKIQGDAITANSVDYTIYGLDNDVLKQLAYGQLASSIGDLYTADSVDVISTIIIVNTESFAQNINLFMTPSGGTARRIIAKDLSLGAGYSLHWSGDKISVMNALGQVEDAIGDGLENIVEDTSPQLGGELDVNDFDINLADEELTRAKLKDYAITLHDGGFGGDFEVDLEKGNMFKRVLTDTCTLTFVNPPKTGDGCKFDLILVQDSTSAESVSWPGSISWDSGTDPVITGLGYTYIFSFLTIDNGTTWYGDLIGGSTTPPTSADYYTFVWGYNSYGSLGLEDTIQRLVPTALADMDAKEISAGYESTAAIKTDGTLWTWGRNTYGQLGQGTDGLGTDLSSPVKVGALTDWSKISCEYYSTGAIKTDGTLWTWGYNDYGQLGQGTDGAGTNLSSPVKVGALTTWSQVDIGWYSTAAIKSDGTLWTWGNNSLGQLGHNNTTDLSSPVQVGALTDWSKISCEYYSTGAIKTDGTLWTWGYNDYGQLGQGTSGLGTDLSSPVKVGTLTTWSQVSIGFSHMIALKTDGTIWTWGYNSSGQLGHNNITNFSSPVQVGVAATWSQVDASGHQSFGRRSSELYGWGYNYYGQLGLGNTDNRYVPTKVGDGAGNFSSGIYHTIATT